MRRLFIIATLVLSLVLVAFVTVAGAGGSGQYCKFGQKNRPGCVWPTTTTSDGLTCHDRGCGGFPRRR